MREEDCEPITDEDDEREAVSQFVRTRRGARSVGTRQFVKEPVRRRTQTLLVLLPVGIVSTLRLMRSNGRRLNIKSLKDSQFEKTGGLTVRDPS